MPPTVSHIILTFTFTVTFLKLIYSPSWNLYIKSSPNRRAHLYLIPDSKSMANFKYCPRLHQNCTARFLIPKTKAAVPDATPAGSLWSQCQAFDPWSLLCSIRNLWSPPWKLRLSIILWRDSETWSTAFNLKWVSAKESWKQVPFPKPVYLNK